ncbi:MAG: hypothetical protein ONB30_00945 [candidate division KSB1 bacterium]|nr:hypothetical protein [candidate division KSB1 bacterium]
MKKRMVTFVLCTLVLGYLTSWVSGQTTDAVKRLKRRVAVFDFQDKTAHHYHWWTGQPVGEGMADMLVTALVKTGNYRVFERKEMEALLKEQSLGMAGIVTPESAAQAGKMLGVELAIVGAVTEFGYSEGGVGGRVKGIGVGVKSTKATVAIDVRFINTTTGEILVAETVRKERSSKGLGLDTPEISFDNRDKFDESLVGKATRDAIDALVEMVEKSAANVPWQAKIIKTNGSVFINAGAEAGVQNGDVFVIYRKGEELIDPDTGLSLGSVDTKIGRIKVTNNNLGNGKASECVVLEGSGFQREDIVRLQ